jgi:DNA-binding NarL/FixJ family response regulator
MSRINPGVHCLTRARTAMTMRVDASLCPDYSRHIEMPTGNNEIAPDGLRPILALLVSEHRLSARESEVLELAAIGRVNKEIAAVLNCSPKTIDVYWSRLFAKLRIHSRAEALAIVLRRALATKGH